MNSVEFATRERSQRLSPETPADPSELEDGQGPGPYCPDKDRVNDPPSDGIDRVAEAASGGPADVPPNGVLGLVELILKDRPRLERSIRDTALQPGLMPGLLAIALSGFTLFGVALSVVLSTAGVWPELSAVRDVIAGDADTLIAFATAQEGWAAEWFDGSVLSLIVAYTVGLIAATGVCLPSLYFYGLLAGVRMTMLDVTLHALKSKATSAVALIGILPIYAAICMGMVIFHAAPPLMNASLMLGLILPFIAGFWGTRSLYVGFSELSDTMPAEFRCHRSCFLRRLVFSWAACYTAVMPVMIYTLWEYFGT